MGSNEDAFDLCKLDRLVHNVKVTGVLAASDVDSRDVLHHGRIVAESPIAIRFAHVAVDFGFDEGRHDVGELLGIRIEGRVGIVDERL